MCPRSIILEELDLGAFKSTANLHEKVLVALNTDLVLAVWKLELEDKFFRIIDFYSH